MIFTNWFVKKIMRKNERKLETMKCILNNKNTFIKKGLMISCLISVTMIFTACQVNDHNNENEVDHSAMPQTPIEVTFATDPDSHIQVGERVELIAKVTQEGEMVDDAELVRFEIWYEEDTSEKDDNDHSNNHDAMEDYDTKHEMIEAEHRGDGQYVLEYSFEQFGTYHVMYHVDARGFHSMTAHEVVVEE